MRNMEPNKFEFSVGGKDYLSYSAIKYLLESPQSFERYRTVKEDRSTEALNFGKAYDVKILSPKEYKDSVVISPVFNKRTNVGKAAYAEFVEASEGKIIINEAEEERILEMEVVLESAGVMAYFDGAASQVSKVGYINGIKCMGILDSYDSLYNSAVDLKSMADSDPRKFHYDAIKFKYPLQAYMYKELFGLDTMLFVAQSKKAPYNVGVFETSQGFLDKGEDMFVAAVKTLKEYFSNGNSVITNPYIYRATL